MIYFLMMLLSPLNFMIYYVFLGPKAISPGLKASFRNVKREISTAVLLPPLMPDARPSAAESQAAK